MRIVTISDTHNKHKRLELPDGDLLIHSGDLSSYGYKNEIESILSFFRKQLPKYEKGIVFIAGNHDRSFDPKYFREYEDHDLFVMHEEPEKPMWLQNMLSDLGIEETGIEYLEDNSVTVDGVKIWGSPITPWFNGERWGFNKHRGDEINKVWKEIPNDTDIIITHGPAFGQGDWIPETQEYVGCNDLRNHVLRVKPLLHVFGHIHSGYGTSYNQDTTFVNPSILNNNYEIIHKPIVIDLDKENKEIKIL